jgi:hypothetical protein
MTDPAELRAQARLCRWAASIRTDGGSHADRVLLVLAERLEQEAAARDVTNCRSADPKIGGPAETSETER